MDELENINSIILGSRKGLQDAIDILGEATAELDKVVAKLEEQDMVKAVREASITIANIALLRQSISGAKHKVLDIVEEILMLRKIEG